MSTDRTILLVEDNADDEELTVRGLRRAGIANPIAVARNGAEALDWLHGTGPHAGPGAPPLPAVVLLDLRLPKVDGLEVLRRLRAEERFHALPVVILTSSREERDIVEGYRLGANSYVRKPVVFAEFADAVRQLGLYWLVINEPLPR